jgi:hypothetical protein
MVPNVEEAQTPFADPAPPVPKTKQNYEQKEKILT